MSYTSRACQPLEPRRLLSAEVPVDFVEPDLPLADDTSDVVVADDREQIYPPLAPAMWVDESIGSFEEPAEITVAFFGRDPLDEPPVADEAIEQPIAPPVIDASEAAPTSRVSRPTSIAQEILGDDEGAAVA